MLGKRLAEIASKVVEDKEYSLTPDEISELLQVPQENISDLIDLMKEAYRISNKYKGKRVHICSIINARCGLCSEDCAFCAQSVYHNTNIRAYPMLDAEEIAQKAIQLYKAGARFFSFVTSGYMITEDDVETICKAARIIKQETDLTLCASLGVLTLPLARQLREAGIETYHHNLETSRSYFGQICTTHAYEKRIQTVEIAKECGFKVCCGGVFGLGETWYQRVELALTLKKLHVDRVPVNFLIPIPGTRMENRPLLHPFEALKIISLYRFLLPDKDIIICGGRETTLRDLQSWLFIAGANGIIIGDYLTTRGRNSEDDFIMMRDLGLG